MNVIKFSYSHCASCGLLLCKLEYASDLAGPAVCMLEFRKHLQLRKKF